MHRPVLLKEVLTSLALKPGMKVIDATVGGGGHARVILDSIGPTGQLLGLDADASTVKSVEKAFNNYPNARFIQAWFDSLELVTERLSFHSVDAILFDLGFSSLQLDDPERGFSFQADGPLDMRLDPNSRLTASTVINRRGEKELADIFYRYGELYDARRLARQIVEAREKQPIGRTLQLVTILGLKNPGVMAKIFQALRIAVNDELNRLQRAIPQAVSILKPGGRIAIITFHSLEDRIVKQAFRDNYFLTAVTKKPVVPSEEEIATNPRSRSAKLRVAEKASP